MAVGETRLPPKNGQMMMIIPWFPTMSMGNEGFYGCCNMLQLHAETELGAGICSRPSRCSKPCNTEDENRTGQHTSHQRKQHKRLESEQNTSFQENNILRSNVGDQVNPAL